MWTYTLYILHAFVSAKKPQHNSDGSFTISITEFYDFVFDELWRKFQVTFYDDEEDLYEDLQLLAGMNFIKIADTGRHIIISKDQWETIENVANSFRTHPLRQNIPLVDEYFKRIEAIIG
jgi:hypothetical protein